MDEVLVRNAERMMTAAAVRDDGVLLTFADGYSGLIPFADLPEITERSDFVSIELPTPYMVVVKDSRGSRHGIPWAFARLYCDPSYRAHATGVAERGSLSLADRLREIRTAGGMTQEQLSFAAGVSRVTLVRLESGAHLPRYDTLVAIAEALGSSPAELLAKE